MLNNLSKKILILGYGKEQTILIEELIKIDCKVDWTENIIFEASDYDLIISFGYRHIIKKEFILSLNSPIINLHISYLPWNKGAHPNFWSFYDCTPSGVTIHLIDEGVDTGPIIYQKYVNFEENELTFRQTYNRLIKELEKLFISKIINIITGNYVPIYQRREGTYHKSSELPKEFRGWDSNIKNEVIYLDQIINRRSTK